MPQVYLSGLGSRKRKKKSLLIPKYYTLQIKGHSS